MKQSLSQRLIEAATPSRTTCVTMYWLSVLSVLGCALAGMRVDSLDLLTLSAVYAIAARVGK